MPRRRSIGNGGGGGHDSGMMRWLLTYADLITLLLAFFVIMYAISTADQKKFKQLKSSLQTALGTTGAGNNIIMEYSGNTPIDAAVADIQVQENNEFKDIVKNIQAGVADPRNVAFYIDERGLTIRFLDNVLFDIGKAELRPDSTNLLDAVGQALKSNHNYMRIEGHADNLPINTLLFPSNWELSASRSIAVTRYLIERHAMDPKRLSSLGYGEYRPLYPNTTEENRAKNRRVDIVVLRSDRSGAEMEGAIQTKTNIP